VPIKLTDAEIARLVAEQKPLPNDYQSRLQIRPKRGHKERELEVQGAAGSEFLLILRQSDLNPLDFSVILGYRLPGLSTVFRLRRYTARVISTRTESRVRSSTSFTSMRPRNDIKPWELARTATRAPRLDTATSARQ
jgi:hypothetical protein